MKVAVFGSAFNPPTKGHADAIESILAHANHYERVVLIPSFCHAFAKNMIDYSHRVAMLNAFVSDLQDDRIHALPVEHLISDGESPVYTYDVLSYLHNTQFSGDQLTFVIGPDNKANWPKFYKAQEIEEKWHVLVVPERQSIRSTMVREVLAEGNAATSLITPSVADYINRHQLYA